MDGDLAMEMLGSILPRYSAYKDRGEVSFRPQRHDPPHAILR